MRYLLSPLLAALLVTFNPLPVQAEDIPLVSAVSTSTSSAQSSEFTCGIQISIRCDSADARYRICHAVSGTTCTATASDLKLSQATIYDIGVRGDSSGILCRVAFITDSGSGSCTIKQVLPRTLPETP